jgi:hypothetical protein
MPIETIDKRVKSLELGMSELQQLPARMIALEGQILQLRGGSGSWRRRVPNWRDQR